MSEAFHGREHDKATAAQASTRAAAQRIFVRGPWELAASTLIGLGVLMLMQPFSMWAYTYSFIVLLVGTIGFIVVSHFPE
jgi:predicted lipid-binding transport protein (Tim44 family)